MLSALKKIFSPPAEEIAAYEVYSALVAQSRKPFFYARMGVPDTLDGRFDVIVLHLFLVIQRLCRENTQNIQEFIRLLTEAFFSDMDRSLREMGSTDTGVGKRVKKMSQAFFGRLQAYEQASGSGDALQESLARNLYRGQASSASAEAVCAYLRRNEMHLAAQDAGVIAGGKINFLD